MGSQSLLVFSIAYVSSIILFRHRLTAPFGNAFFVSESFLQNAVTPLDFFPDPTPQSKRECLTLSLVIIDCIEHPLLPCNNSTNPTDAMRSSDSTRVLTRAQDVFVAGRVVGRPEPLYVSRKRPTAE